MGSRSNNATLISITAGSLLAAMALIALPMTASAKASSREGPLPAPTLDSPVPTGAESETAVLAGGCFWTVQGLFEHVRGVRQVVAGYAGGGKNTANYALVSTGQTRQAESVEITFDPRQISYGEILRIFFSVVSDPTQVDGQYPDEGPQYRSEIFFANPNQQRIALAYIGQLGRSGAFRQPIATRVDPVPDFFPAEAYHQDFLVRPPRHPYIVAWDLPKLAALARDFPAQYQSAPITIASR